MSSLNQKQKIETEETIFMPSKIVLDGIVYSDPYKKIKKITAEFNGFKKEYYVSDFGPKIAVLVIYNDKVLFTRQYRLLLNNLSFDALESIYSSLSF